MCCRTPLFQSLGTTSVRLRCEPRHGPSQTLRSQESEIHAHRCLQSQVEQPRAGQGCGEGCRGHPGLIACLHLDPSSPHPAQDTRDPWPSPWALPTPVHPHAALRLSRTQVQSHSLPPTPPHDPCKKYHLHAAVLASMTSTPHCPNHPCAPSVSAGSACQMLPETPSLRAFAHAGPYAFLPLLSPHSLHLHFHGPPLISTSSVTYYSGSK